MIILDSRAPLLHDTVDNESSSHIPMHQKEENSMPTISLPSCSSRDGLSGYGIRISLHDDCLYNLLLFRVQDFCEIVVELRLLLLQFFGQACQSYKGR